MKSSLHKFFTFLLVTMFFPIMLALALHERKRSKLALKRLRQNQSGILYILVTIILFLLILGAVWFCTWAIMTPLSQALEPLAESYYDDSWSLWTPFQYALTFMTNLWTYLLALAFFGLVLWVWMMSQHRGQPY